MRLSAALVSAALLSIVSGCAMSGDPADEEDLGDIGDGKSDSFGVVDKAFTVAAGHSRRFTFTASAAFHIAVTQPDTPDADRSELTLSLKKPDDTKVTADAAKEPTLVVDEGGDGPFTLTVKNVGEHSVSGVLNVRPLGGFGDLPNPNAEVFPEASWQPPALDQWPATYVIFNNTGCGHDCTQADSTALAPRSVMIKMLVTAIHGVKQGGIVRVSNFNISSSASAKPVVDALRFAMTERGATVKIVMDEGQNNPTSMTTQLGTEGAQVRFLNGLTFTNSVGPAVGIMHSKIVAVDDQVVLTGSNNFSSTGFIINEENSVVLRAPENSDRIASFVCDIDTMFQIGVPAGQVQKTDDERRESILALDSCNGPDVFFPPTGTLATGTSITQTEVTRAISGATKSIAIAPDMMAHPGLVSAIISRAKKAKAAGQAFSVRLILDASPEALGNPAFGECLTDAANDFGLDIQVRYWPGTPEAFQLMHHKFMLIDAADPAKATLYNGSANYSSKALKESFENVTRYSVAQYRGIVDAFSARFDQMFAQGKDKAKLAAEDHITAPACSL
jgi:HKD family nuclease